MSGIVGIVNFDGAPVDRALLRRMTDFMTFRGPDEQRIWVDGNVGFGHTLLRTTLESEHEHQPFTLDGQVWIVADARVDAQADLITKLNARGEHVMPGVTDVELLLRAYRVWDEDCVDHLLGDFAFAVWDAPQRRLFCARDPLGVKPFFYAHLGQTVIFSNTLDCIRQHPGVSGKLNDLAIADFLVFGWNQDPATTAFASIQRIPPAHVVMWSSSDLQLSRYWTLPVDDPVYFRHCDDYTCRFKELLNLAVSDRLRTKKIAIFMSGGLDSPALAATAISILRGRSADAEVRAFTTTIDSIDRNERHYARLVAEHLRIPIHFWDRSAEIIDPGWNDSAIHTSEPVGDPTNLAGIREHYSAISASSRVVFYGEGPDNALHYEWRAYLSYLLRNRRFRRLVTDVGRHMIQHRRIPLLPTIPRMLKNWKARGRWQPPFPGWLNPEFESRMRLRARWEAIERSPDSMTSHPLRPVGHHSFQPQLWQSLFEGMDPGETMAPVEARHPYVDLRLLRYMLAVPAIPWCRAKYLVRRAMRGTLPPAVLRRPKSPLTGDPEWAGMRHSGLPELHATPALREYVNCERVPPDAGADMVRFRLDFRPFVLNYWLQNLRQEPYKLTETEEDQENEFISTRT